MGVSRKQRARDIRAGLWGAVEGGGWGCFTRAARRPSPGDACLGQWTEGTSQKQPEVPSAHAAFSGFTACARRSPSPLQSRDLVPCTDCCPPTPTLGSFSLFRLSWLEKSIIPPPHPHLLFSLTPQMKFQHMSPDIIPLRLRITLPTDTVFCPGLLAPKCLPKRLGPLLEGLSLPWANSEYL